MALNLQNVTIQRRAPDISSEDGFTTAYNTAQGIQKNFLDFPVHQAQRRQALAESELGTQTAQANLENLPLATRVKKLQLQGAEQNVPLTAELQGLQTSREIAGFKDPVSEIRRASQEDLLKAYATVFGDVPNEVETQTTPERIKTLDEYTDEFAQRNARTDLQFPGGVEPKSRADLLKDIAKNNYNYALKNKPDTLKVPGAKTTYQLGSPEYYKAIRDNLTSKIQQQGVDAATQKALANIFEKGTIAKIEAESKKGSEVAKPADVQTLAELNNLVGKVEQGKALVGPGQPNIVGPAAGSKLKQAWNYLAAAAGSDDATAKRNNLSKLHQLTTKLWVEMSGPLKGALSDREGKKLEQGIPKDTDDESLWVDYLTDLGTYLRGKQQAIAATSPSLEKINEGLQANTPAPSAAQSVNGYTVGRTYMVNGQPYKFVGTNPTTGKMQWQPVQ